MGFTVGSKSAAPDSSSRACNHPTQRIRHTYSPRSVRAYAQELKTCTAAVALGLFLVFQNGNSSFLAPSCRLPDVAAAAASLLSSRLRYSSSSLSIWSSNDFHRCFLSTSLLAAAAAAAVAADDDDEVLLVVLLEPGDDDVVFEAPSAGS